MPTKIEIYVDSSEEMSLIAPFLVELEKLRDVMFTSPAPAELHGSPPLSESYSEQPRPESKQAGMDIFAARKALAGILADDEKKKLATKLMRDEFGTGSLADVKDLAAYVARAKEVCK